MAIFFFGDALEQEFARAVNWLIVNNRVFVNRRPSKIIANDDDNIPGGDRSITRTTVVAVRALCLCNKRQRLDRFKTFLGGDVIL